VIEGTLFKVEGSGNDFLLGVGDWAGRLATEAELTIGLCDRRRGIGADGTLAIETVGPGRVRLVYRNSDGTVAAFCANGTRCAARAAVELLDCPTRLIVETGWGEIPATVDGAVVTLELPPPERAPESLLLRAGDLGWECWRVVVGVPQLVIPVEDPELLDLQRVAPPLRRHAELGPDGANLNFTARRADGSLVIRSWERGIEGETLCCGSGVVAAALCEMAGSGARRLVVRPRSGDELVVEALGEAPVCPVLFTGPTRCIAEIVPVGVWE
jgi:diaminopimelate epimerase